MKKIALLAICFALAVTFAACGKKKPSDDPQTANTTVTDAGETGTTVVGEVDIDELVPTTGKPKTRVVTEKGGKTVTDKDQKPVTEVVTRVVTDKDGKAETTEITRIVTDKDNKTVTDASKNPVTDRTNVTKTEVVTEPVTTVSTAATTTASTKAGETTGVSYDDIIGWSEIKPIP